MSNGTTAAADRIGTVRPIDITDTMQEAYLDYAMSVIVSRALPDVRDGLKPVHRRILYAMYHDLGLTFNKPHKKSARIVGEVLGKYHPHGDTAVYDAMVRMAQEFSLRYMLVDGQGNFGSIDGDNAAAMRYTEARLAEISDLMLTDLEKDTVGWHDNFDNSLREPDILPAALPNLLINGSSGIAVGMATNIPPHNLGEVVDALEYMIDHYRKLDDVTIEHLLQFIQGPDFPTGGILYRFREEKNSDDLDVITQGYSVGRARLILQAKAHFEEMSRNRSRIVITELPYQTNKTALIERIASLVRDGKIEGITDLRDESDRTGMRIVIELTRNVDPKDILADLFKYTPLQQTFGMQALALVDGQPRLLSLKRMLHLFIQHREEIIQRRSEYELARAKERAHILEGLLKALDILDEVIATIRNSQRVDTARNNLMRNFAFTEIQAQAILDMQLRRLAALERKKLQDEYKELLKRIGYLEDLLAHPEKVLAVIKEDLLAIKEKYGDARRTQIVDRTKGTLTSTDLLPEQDVWVSVASNGDLIRRNVVRSSKTTTREIGKGSQVALLTTNTRDFLFAVSHDGRSARIPIHEVPQERAKHLSELTDFSRRDDITAAFPVPRVYPDVAQGYLFMVTELGAVKRVTLADFVSASAGNPTLMNVDANDRMVAVFHTPGEQEVILVSSGGKSIRFAEEDVRSMGLAAGGVGGMKLKKGEKVVYAGLVDPNGELITITANGYAKRSALSDYSTQGRNGGGIVTHKPNSRTGNVTAALVIGRQGPGDPDPFLAVASGKNQVSALALSAVPKMGRAVQGKQIMALGMSDVVATIHVVADPSDLPTDDPNGSLKTATGAKLATTTTTQSSDGKQSAARTRPNAKARSRAPAKRATVKGTAKSGANGVARSRVMPTGTKRSADSGKSAPAEAAARTGSKSKPRTSTQRSQSKASSDAPTVGKGSTGKSTAAPRKKPARAASGSTTAASPSSRSKYKSSGGTTSPPRAQKNTPPPMGARAPSATAKTRAAKPAASAAPQAKGTASSAGNVKKNASKSAQQSKPKTTAITTAGSSTTAGKPAIPRRRVANSSKPGAKGSRPQPNKSKRTAKKTTGSDTAAAKQTASRRTADKVSKSGAQASSTKASTPKATAKKAAPRGPAEVDITKARPDTMQPGAASIRQPANEPANSESTSPAKKALKKKNPKLQVVSSVNKSQKNQKNNQK